MLGTQGGDGRGLVEPDIGIELLRQGSIRVVAQEFCLGPVDHADEPLQARLEQALAKRIMPSFPKIEQETGDAREVAEPLATLPMRGTDALHRHGPAPIGRCRDRAGMRTEADQSGPITEGLATELPDVQLLPDNAHAGIADMGVVRPEAGRITSWATERSGKFIRASVGHAVTLVLTFYLV